MVFQVMRARRPDEPATPLLVPEPFTIIFEYKQLANSPLELQNWAQEWFALSTEADDNVLADRLAELTPCFTDAFDAARECPFKRTQEEIDAMEPPLPNNVPLGQVRTNEIALGLRANPTLPWELREFNMCLPPPRQEAGQEQRQECLRPGIAQEQEEEQEQQQEQQQALQQEQDRPLRLLNVTVKLTPDREVFNETSLVDVLAHFVNERVDGFGVGELLRFQLSNGNDLQKVMPNVFEGFHFVSGHAITPADWLARELVPIGETQPGVFRPNPLNTWLLGTPQEDNVAFEDRLWFSFNTCNGCHSGDTGTVFTHVDLRGAGRRPPNAGPEVPLVSHNVPSNFLCNFDLPARRRGLVNMRSIAEDNNFRETLDLMQELVAQAPDGRPVDPNEQGAGIAESSLLATVEQQAVILNGPVQDGGQQDQQQQDQQQQDQQQQEEQQPGGLRLPPCTMAAQRPGPIMEGQNPYDREWMACYMLERQTRVH